jgi:hypothetical protein
MRSIGPQAKSSLNFFQTLPKLPRFLKETGVKVDCGQVIEAHMETSRKTEVLEICWRWLLKMEGGRKRD